MISRMRKIILLLTAICFAVSAEAQTFTEKLQRVENGKGTVVVNQSSDIDRLVNHVTSAAAGNNNAAGNSDAGRTNTQKETQHAGKTAEKHTPYDKKENANNGNNASSANNGRSPETADNHTKESEKPDNSTAERTTNTPTENDAEDVNLNKKIMRNSYKTKGYRIQVYSGGNKRIDREKCNQIAARLKSSFPTLPVYVHFYSPSWKCRAGNFTDYAEAQEMLKQVKAMGYTQACLVKGTINVQY